MIIIALYSDHPTYREHLPLRLTIAATALAVS